jgi:predicted dehydrogenase
MIDADYEINRFFGKNMNKTKINLAILGCGYIARQHLAELKRIPGVHIRACWNRPDDFRLAEQFQAASGADYCTSDYLRIAADPEIDGVYICTMHNSRVALLEAMAAGGKAVFMEKPLALHPEEFQAMAAILERTPIFFQSGYKIRFNTLMRELRQRQLRPEIIYSHVFDFPWPEQAPAANRHIGGGHMLSQGVYAADTIRILADAPPVAVTAMINERNTTNCRHGSLAAIFRFANGTIGNLVLTDNAVAPEIISKFFTEATGPGWGIGITERFGCLRTTSANAPETVERFEEDGFLRQSESFVERLRRRDPDSACSFADGVIPSLMIFKALEAAHGGGTVKIDLDAWLKREKIVLAPSLSEL